MIKVTSGIRNNLFNGKPLQLSNGLNIYPLTYGEIQNYGYENYLTTMSLLTMDKEDLSEFGKFTNFGELIYSKGSMDVQLQRLAKEMFELLLRIDFAFIFSDDIICSDTKDITKSLTLQNYNELVDILRLQYQLANKQNEHDNNSYKPKNSKAQEMIDKIKEGKKKKQEKLNNKSDEEKDIKTDLSSISSYLLCKYLNGNKALLYNMTIYEIHESYQRIHLINQYDFTMIGTHTGKIDMKALKSEDLDCSKIIKM